MKKSVVCLSAALFLVTLLVVAAPLSAQTVDSVDQQVAALRADMKADKANIIKESMQLTPDQAKAFWPVYNEYDKDLTAVNDELVALIKKYAQQYGSITDADAKQLTEKAFAIQSRKIEIKKKYFGALSKATTPLLAAKYFQLDYRLELLLNLKITSELPALLYQAPVAPAQKTN